jgi:hypothetical protein
MQALVGRPVTLGGRPSKGELMRVLISHEVQKSKSGQSPYAEPVSIVYKDLGLRR